MSSVGVSRVFLLFLNSLFDKPLEGVVLQTKPWDLGFAPW